MADKAVGGDSDDGGKEEEAFNTTLAAGFQAALAALGGGDLQLRVYDLRSREFGRVFGGVGGQKVVQVGTDGTGRYYALKSRRSLLCTLNKTLNWECMACDLVGNKNTSMHMRICPYADCKETKGLQVFARLVLAIFACYMPILLILLHAFVSTRAGVGHSRKFVR
jgi:hypothetical protein